MDLEKKPRKKSERSKPETRTPHKIRDNIFKTVFGEPRLFAEFLENFIPVDILKNISPDDIDDISERFTPLFSDNKDSDTVKRINLNGENLFVVGILEHESEVNYQSPFKMLVYITYVLNDYVKENDKKYHDEIKKNGSTKLILSTAKDFKYPPVLPIVFYDGTDKWTSEVNFLNKTKMREVFEKYIPKFEYELVDLNKYTKDDLVKYNNVLSLIMLMDKVRKSEDMGIMFSGLPENYVEALCDAEKIPEPLLKIISDCIGLLLKRVEVPAAEIEAVTEKIYQRKVNDMFEILDGYSVTKTRKEAKEEGKQEGRQEAKKEYEAEKKEYEAEKKEYEAKIKELEAELKKYKN
jgi:hypothetical protein